MIAFLTGGLTFVSPTHVHINVNGVGYHVNISLYTYERIESLKEVTLQIHHHITENDQSLFGFFEDEEKSVFKHLISVSGVGPSTARMATSYMAPLELRQAIISENAQAVSKIKGIGPKTAKRIILDLKDKMFKESDGKLEILLPTDPSIKEEAVSALVSLGFQKAKVSKTVEKTLKELDNEITVEALIKSVLRQLS